MAYTFLDLKTKLTTQISDPNLDSTVMGDALNYTQQEVFGKFDLTLNSDSQTNSVLTGTNTLASAMPTDYERMSSLYVTSPTGLSTDLTDYFVPIKDFRAQFPLPSIRGNSGLSYWTYWTSLLFSNNADQDYTVILDYVKSVPFMSADADVPVIPQAFEELLMLGAKMRVYEQKEDFDYASQFTNRYADLLEAFAVRYSTRQVDNQIVIPGARRRV
jgi:hypothetical protein